MERRMEFGGMSVANRQWAGLALVAILCGPATAQAEVPPNTVTHRFSFSPGRPAEDYTQVQPGTLYSQELGYGFEPGAVIKAIDRGGTDPLYSGFCTSDKPFYFSVALPEGNYKVLVTLGDPQGESTTTVKAELRRLMLERVRTPSSRLKVREFDVNVRTPQIAGGGHVHLKPREKTDEAWAWDEKLTLEFNDARPCVVALEITPAPELPTVYLLGDSTVCDQPREPWNSWGQMLPRFFRPGVVVANEAESGESLRSSLAAKRLDKVLSTMKPGDYLFIQYGHNDMKEKGEGVGAFTTYKADLKKFIDGARQHGGMPVLLTSMHRKRLDGAGKIINTLGDYPEAVRQTAHEENVPLIDLNAMSARLYEAWGPEYIDHAFVDGTHHNNYGSYELARCVIEGIQQNKLPLAKFVIPDLPRFDPAHPDPIESFRLPASPSTSQLKPDGN
jgi:lysophospholipase L1-like esterase